MAEYKLKTPLTEKDVKKLRIGDKVLLSGTVFTARDAAHLKMTESIKKGKKLPFNIRNQVIYFSGPTPSRPGRVIGSAGPTTAGRMDAFTPILLKRGLKATIGKGKRSKAVVDAMKKHKAVYFAAAGGAGALLSHFIKKAEVIAYADLGTEAIRKLEIENFPLIVANDSYGKDIFEEGIKKYRRRR